MWGSRGVNTGLRPRGGGGGDTNRVELFAGVENSCGVDKVHIVVVDEEEEVVVVAMVVVVVVVVDRASVVVVVEAVVEVVGGVEVGGVVVEVGEWWVVLEQGLVGVT